MKEVGGFKVFGNLRLWMVNREDRSSGFFSHVRKSL